MTSVVKFAQMLLTNPSGPLVDPNKVIDAFMSKQAVPQITAVLLEALKANRADQGPLQTRLLEINLQFAPQVAAIAVHESHATRGAAASLRSRVRGRPFFNAEQVKRHAVPFSVPVPPAP